MTSPASAYWSAARRDPDNPFEKYKAQRSATYTQRTRRRSRVTKYVLAAVALLCVFLLWRGGSSSPVAGYIPGRGRSTHLRWGETAPEAGRLRGSEPRDRSQIGREKASLVMLVRNRELTDALTSMKQIEERFNRYYRYPWTFLNDEPFTDEFQNHTTRMASGQTFYGVIPESQWSMPPWISEDRFQETVAQMRANNVIYGDSRTYRHMCRYNSGFFFRHPLLAGYDYYWRVEPSIGFYCDQLYDPFTFMREHGKKYSFVITMPEYRETIATLWSTTQEFAAAYPQYIAPNNSLGFVVDTPELGIAGSDYNNCHFWSNFEIGDLNFWRGEAYEKYFDFLDQKGGFYYERWGDAPVHSIAAALFLNKEEVHFFEDMGYKHVPWGRCPADDYSHDTARCICPFERQESFDFNGWSCQPKWWKLHGLDEKTGKKIADDADDAAHS